MAHLLVMGYPIIDSNGFKLLVMSNKFTSRTVISIMNKRTLVPATMEGKKVRLTVRGNGVLIDVKTKDGELVQSIIEEGMVFQKVVFNTESNSGLAMSNPLNKALSAAAIAAERAGNVDEADKLFKDFLNGVQLSFSVPSTSSILAKLTDRVDISAKVIKITTENGSLLTIDPTSISVLAPEELKAVSFSFDAEPEAEVAPVDETVAGALQA